MSSNISEVWKDVVGFESYYEVSSMGRVRRVEKIIEHKRLGQKIVRSRVLKQANVGNTLYKKVNLYKNDRCTCVAVHRIVAKAFIPNKYDKIEVNHIDGKKENNEVSNLEWVSRKENINHSIYILKNNFGASLSCNLNIGDKINPMTINGESMIGSRMQKVYQDLFNNKKVNYHSYCTSNNMTKSCLYNAIHRLRTRFRLRIVLTKRELILNDAMTRTI